MCEAEMELQDPEISQILGDAWERTYGDVEWHGMSGNRYLPWYFLAKLSEKVLCFGVKVRPSAMCCWQVDTKGNYFVSGCSLRKYRSTAERKKAVCRTDRLHGSRRSRYF